MPRFCATLASLDPDLTRMGGTLAYWSPPCALGLVPGEHPGGTAGPYFAGQSLAAVGEVTLFNRRDLIAELAEADIPPLETAADGEILLQFYHHFGLDGLARVNGMFALAIWDGDSLLLVRDPVGMRTLFYSYQQGCWAAGSSLRALRRWPRLPARLNLAAVRSFLTFAYLPGEETLLDGVHELLPGCALRLRPHNPHAELISYWEPAEQLWNPDDLPKVYATHLRQLLEQATRACLPPGEEVGVTLSGGLDSSLVAALAAQLHDRPARSYAINFGRDLPNETAFSDLVAVHCGTQHRVLTFNGRQIAQHLEEAVGYLDSPVGDPLTVPNLLLARAAAADGLRVLLNGEGGDPLFGGPKNIPMLVYEWHRTNADPLDRARAYLRSYRKCYLDLPHLLSAEAQAALQDAPPLERLVLPYLEAEQMPHYLNRLMYANTRLKGSHHILTKVERLTASCGLEGRAPIFDPAVVYYAFAIPPTLKLAGTVEKWILKEAARDLLPDLIIDRPKSGMRVPVQHWLDGPLRSLSNDLLLGQQARARGLFNPQIIQTWLRGEGKIWPRHGAALWLVLTLEIWLRAYLDH